MTKVIGRNINTTDEATLPADIALNSSTSTKIADAVDDRIVFEVYNLGEEEIRIKLQAASVDDDFKGIPVACGHSWSMSTDNIYTGEISAQSESGTPSVAVTEY